MKRITIAIALTLGASIGLQTRDGDQARGRAASLTNGRITAEFGGRGLVSLADASIRDSQRFSEDGFAITIDGQAFDSRTLPTPTRTATTERVVYAWTAGPYRVTVTYRVAPDSSSAPSARGAAPASSSRPAAWRFVSKEIAVTAAGARTFRVGEVTVFRAGLADPITDVFVPKSVRPNLGTGDYGACLRFNGGRGLLAVAQNPFLSFTRAGQSFSLAYRPDMEWNLDWGPFVADRGLLAPYRLAGRSVPERMLPEWRMGPIDGKPGMDEAEIEAFTDLVRAFLLVRPARPVNVLVGWCLNDYQIDVGSPEGRAEYKRVMDRAASLGADYVLYAPSNSELSRREQSVDDWSWEHVLWLNLGQQIRKNEWNARTSPVPASVQEMLDYGRSKNLKLLAYVYPVLPFSQNPGWLVTAKNNPSKRFANLGFRSLQDFLIDTLVAFHDRLGLGGYAFDHTFLTYEGTSRYAQWYGWRRVMKELRKRIPDIVIDGRQAYHQYGPWSWLAGSYPHPTFSDEQPESFVPFPDLHFDRVSADRERYTAYRYRNYEFAPSEIVPGFITHQTSRGDDTGEMPEKKTDKGTMLRPLRARDWDYLGWRYSLLSSIAIAGWNNVIDMVPARDEAENRLFSETDRQFFRRWIDWTNANKEFLRHTRTILGQPAIGKIDGTSAIVGDRGFIFLFNPNGRAMNAEFTLDAATGVPPDRRFFVRELYPLENRLIGKPATGVWSSGDRVSIAMDGGSALVLELQPVIAPSTTPLVFNTPGTATLDNRVLSVTGVVGEVGTHGDTSVWLPGGQTPTAVIVNGQKVAFEKRGDLVHPSFAFAGVPFRHYQQIGAYDATSTGGSFRAEFMVPKRVFDQLAARGKAWPIPWTAEDYRATWLAPERLLLFVQIAEPDDRMEAQMWIDDRRVELRKAYSAIRTAGPTLVGFYADLSLVSADQPHVLKLELPPLKPGQFQGVFFENVEPQFTDVLTGKALR